MKQLFAESFLRVIQPLFMIEIDLFAHYREYIRHVQTPRELAILKPAWDAGKHWSTHEIEIQRHMLFAHCIPGPP